MLVSPLISSMKKSMNSYDEESKKSSDNPQHEYFIIQRQNNKFGSFNHTPTPNSEA